LVVAFVAVVVLRAAGAFFAVVDRLVVARAVVVVRLAVALTAVLFAGALVALAAEVFLAAVRLVVAVVGRAVVRLAGALLAVVFAAAAVRLAAGAVRFTDPRVVVEAVLLTGVIW
jgi:hypothetical protein